MITPNRAVRGGSPTWLTPFLLLAACSSTETPGGLLGAIAAGDQAKAIATLEAGADPNAKDPEGRSALLLAARRGLERVVRELIREGADLDARAMDGRTALMEAAAACHPAIVEQLLVHGARKELRDAAGRTAAELATGTSSDCDAVRALLR